MTSKNHNKLLTSIFTLVLHIAFPWNPHAFVKHRDFFHLSILLLWYQLLLLSLNAFQHFYYKPCVQGIYNLPILLHIFFAICHGRFSAWSRWYCLSLQYLIWTPIAILDWQFQKVKGASGTIIFLQNSIWEGCKKKHEFCNLKKKIAKIFIFQIELINWVMTAQWIDKERMFFLTKNKAICLNTIFHAYLCFQY